MQCTFAHLTQLVHIRINAVKYIIKSCINLFLKHKSIQTKMKSWIKNNKPIKTIKSLAFTLTDYEYFCLIPIKQTLKLQASLVLYPVSSTSRSIVSLLYLSNRFKSGKLLSVAQHLTLVLGVVLNKISF